MSSSPSRRTRSNDVSHRKSSRGERNNDSSQRLNESEDSEFNTRGHGPPKIEGMVSLKVDNITQRTGVNLLKKVFGKFGDLGDIYVPRYPDTFASRGFAFVRYYRKRDAEEAMHAMNGERLDGRILSIQMARYARPSPSKLSEKHLSKRTHFHSDYRRNGAPRRAYRRASVSDRERSRRKRSRSRSRERRRHRRSRSRSHSRSRSRSKSRTSRRKARHSRSRSRTRSGSSASRSRSNSRRKSQSRSNSHIKIEENGNSDKRSNVNDEKAINSTTNSNVNVKQEETIEVKRKSRSKSNSNSR